MNCFAEIIWNLVQKQPAKACSSMERDCSVCGGGARGSGIGGMVEWFGQQRWSRSLVKRRWEEGLATGWGRRERVLDVGERKDGVRNLKCNYCPFLQGWKNYIQTFKAVDSVVHRRVCRLST